MQLDVPIKNGEQAVAYLELKEILNDSALWLGNLSLRAVVHPGQAVRMSPRQYSVKEVGETP